MSLTICAFEKILKVICLNLKNNKQELILEITTDNNITLDSQIKNI